VIAPLRIEPGTAPTLHERDTKAVPGWSIEKDEADAELAERVEQIDLLQNHLFAENARSILLVLQGTDTAGKDGAIKNTFRRVNPAFLHVTAFKAPSSTELEHDYLWRVHANLPERGRIGIFNRSHYEDVLVPKGRGLLPQDRIEQRYGHIRDFERMLGDEGTTVVKCLLHISKEEQRERLQARIDDPEKRWKMRLADLDDRKLWDDFQGAYEEMIEATSTDWAPWYVVPSDRKWLRNVVVAEIVVQTLEAMDPKIPSGDDGIEGTIVD
jgi:PPK2 family polyphosphate:nucleotide phosphotransferase